MSKNLSIWAIFPSANTEAANLILRECRDPLASGTATVCIDYGQDPKADDHEPSNHFCGFAIETNILIRACLDSGAGFDRGAGRRLRDPDPKFHAQEIADRFVNQFPILRVAQPLGDKYGAALARLREPRVRLSDHRP